MRVFSVLLAAIAMVSSVGSASAEISRGCRGSIAFEVSQVDTGNGWRNRVRGARQFFTLAVLDGRGYCGNRAVANRCRDRARGAVIGCARAFWRDRWTPAATNEACGLNLDSSRPPHAYAMNWVAAPTGDVKRSIEVQMCCQVEPDARSVTGVVVAYSYATGNNRRCEAREVLSPAYVARCEELREAGLCRPRRVNP